MTLNENRVRECFWLFGMILPVSPEYKENLTKMFGEKYEKVIDDLMKHLSLVCLTNLESFDGYLEFVAQAIDYMRGDTDILPEVDMNHEDYQKMISNYRKELKKENGTT